MVKLGKIKLDIVKYFAEKALGDIFALSWRPTNSGTEILPFSTSKQSCIASLIRERSVDMFLACVWQPLRAGTEAINAPSSSFSMITVNRYFDIKFIPPLVKHSIYGILSQGRLNCENYGSAAPILIKE